jgi:hypothetical protein
VRVYMQVVAAMDALNFSRNPSEQYGLQSCEREAVRDPNRATISTNDFGFKFVLFNRSRWKARFERSETLLRQTKDTRKEETERCIVVSGQGKAWAAFSAADSAGGTASPSVCEMIDRANAEEEDNPAGGGGGGEVDASDEASSAVRAPCTLLLRCLCVLRCQNAELAKTGLPLRSAGIVDDRLKTTDGPLFGCR